MPESAWELLLDDHIFVTSNTVIDALFWVRAQMLGDTELRSSLAQTYLFLNARKNLILMTEHLR